MSFEIGLRGVNAIMRDVDSAAFEIARSANQLPGQPLLELLLKLR